MPSEKITREILGNVPDWLVTSFYVAAAVACGLAAITIALRLRRHRLGTGTTAARPTRQASWKAGLASLARYLVFHRSLLRDPFAFSYLHLWRLSRKAELLRLTVFASTPNACRDRLK